MTFLPRLGVQNDEALFSGAVYQPDGAIYSIEVGKSKLPMMLMSYLGTLKAWLYRPVLKNLRPSLWTLRMPVLLAGALTVWLFFLLLRRTAGVAAAVFASLLLATDPLFLLTTVLDWGPVALQHLLLVSGVAFLLRFSFTGSWKPLAGGFLVFGLALWDKALFSWSLTGLALATLIVFPRELWRLLTPLRMIIALVAFALGALPLILYNVNYDFNTFRANTFLTTTELRGKADLLRLSLQGASLFGWISPENHEVPQPRKPQTLPERASVWLDRVAGAPRHTLLFAGTVGTLALFPLLIWVKARNEIRIVLFGVIFFTVAWLLMALTNGAGASVHHVILLWPGPQVVVGVTLGTLTARWRRGLGVGLAVVLAIVCGSNLLVLNHYFEQTVRNGTALNWTDAIQPLAECMKRTPARQVFVMDWGIFDSLRLLNRGRLALRVGSDPFAKQELSEEDRQEILTWISDPENVFIAHTPGNEFYPGLTPKLEDFSRQAGFQKEILHRVSDTRQRTMFEVFRFSRVSSTGSPGPQTPARALADPRQGERSSPLRS
jgi:hypothetical protein